MNTRRKRFLKIAEARTNKIISLLKLLSNCSNKSNYEYNASEVNKIFTVIQEELNNTKSFFKEKNKYNFSLAIKSYKNMNTVGEA